MGAVKPKDGADWDVCPCYFHTSSGLVDHGRYLCWCGTGSIVLLVLAHLTLLYTGDNALLWLGMNE